VTLSIGQRHNWC